MAHTTLHPQVTQLTKDLAASRIPHKVTYRVTTRMGGRFDPLFAVVKYISQPSANGERMLWKSQGEVCNKITIYMDTSALLNGGLHNRNADTIAK